MVVVEAARRGKQLGEVHGFAVAAVEFVDLGAAAESVGEDLRARRGFPQPVGFQHSATSPDLGFYAARSYSLMRPPRTGRRWVRSLERSATG
jgi:hypothetical protein